MTLTSSLVLPDLCLSVIFSNLLPAATLQLWSSAGRLSERMLRSRMQVSPSLRPEPGLFPPLRGLSTQAASVTGTAPH